jgi:hypothetical protein
MNKFETFLFKKVGLWVPAAIFLFMLLFSLLIGWSVLYVEKGGKKLGKAGSLLIENVNFPFVIKQLVTGSNSPEKALRAAEQRFPGESGFSFTYEPGERPDYPYLLLNRYDSDLKQSVSELIDLNTHKKIYTWKVDVDPVWEKSTFTSAFSDLERDHSTNRFRTTHALLLQDGSIIFRTGLSPLVRFDMAGNLVWMYDKTGFHHSIEPDHEGNIWVPSRIEPPSLDIGDNSFKDDAITQLSPDGEVLFSKSVTQLLEDNQLGYFVFCKGSDSSDPIHLNDIQPVLDDGPYWKKGDLFLSLRNLSMVLLYRPSTNKVLWHTIGPWCHQHDVDILNDREIAVFDNNAPIKKAQMVVDGHNRELVYNFETNMVSNPFRKGFGKLDIKTKNEGRGEFLSDNVLLVEETNSGRLVAFDPEGKIIWQYINRGSNGQVSLVSWSRLVPREIGNTVSSLVKQ